MSNNEITCLSTGQQFGLVLLNMGAPETTKDIPLFIRRLLSDPAMVPLPWPFRQILAFGVSKLRSKKVAARYAYIGGKSPLEAQTRMLSESLRSKLGSQFVVRYAFRYSQPFISNVVKGLAQQNISRVIALPLYPQFSSSTTSSVLDEMRKAAKKYQIRMAEIESFPDAPGFIKSLSLQIQAAKSNADHLLFCAHGLPLRILRKGDVYIEHVHKTMNAIVKNLGADFSYSFAYQSRMGKGKWTRPYLSEEIERLAINGKRSLIVVPLSFVSENLETLYELDYEHFLIAKKFGFKNYQRIATPSMRPAFIEQMTVLARNAARTAGWEVR